MTPEQKVLVQKSFAQVLPIAEVAAELSYGRLFELDPSLRLLFKGDMKAQGRALMSMIQVAVVGLDKLERIVPAVQNLGRRHATYGVTDAYYEMVGAAFIILSTNNSSVQPHPQRSPLTYAFA